VLAANLEKWMNLKHLFITNSQISDIGALELVTGIAKCPSLKNICISDNPITYVGYLALARAFLYRVWRDLFYHKKRWYGCTILFHDIDRCDTWREQFRLLDPWRAVVYLSSSKSTGKKIQK